MGGRGSSIRVVGEMRVLLGVCVCVCVLVVVAVVEGFISLSRVTRRSSAHIHSYILVQRNHPPPLNRSGCIHPGGRRADGMGGEGKSHYHNSLYRSTHTQK